ncbi:MAG: DUF5979 domain-containing protein [Pseudolabrys sp.]|nr:DUF5979 domain-containing protein [Pseudolabrys sp.]
MAKFIARLLPLMLLGQIMSGGATAQQRDRGPDLRLGDVVVTGFSGIVAPNPSQRRPAGKSAIDLTFINPEGPSGRVVDLSKPGIVWDGTVLPAPKPFDVLAKDVGQVFGIALDDAPQPNIYLAATSAFGLNIVARGRDGQPERRKKGGPGVGWMKGQFGLDLQGGPGAIYKIDGRTGVPTLFANVTLDGVPNPGPGLGNLAYDSAHKQLFVSDLYTGMIHRFDLDGKELDRYDHGVTGLTAAKLAPVPFDSRNRPNIASDRFDSEKPETWGFAPAARRVWGLAVHEGRLYYSVTSGPQIWSIGIARDGRFANDPRWELDVPAQAGPLPISDIVFSNKGAMVLAQRALIAGSYDYSAFTRPGEPQVFRIWLKGPKDPPSPGRWKLVPEEYAVGFAGNYRNTNGGVALGYGYGRDGNLSSTACEFSLWTTGQNLRNAPALRGRLDPGGPLVVHGIQGVPASPVRDINTPPWLSYTVGYGDRADDPRAAGHLGSVRIYSKPCNAMAVFGGPGYPVSPPYIVTTTVVVPNCVGSNCPPPPPPRTDIGIAKIGEVNLANPDGPYNFTVGVRNLAGPINNATPLTVTDVVPAGMTFTSVTPTNFTCLPLAPVSGGATLTCTYNGPFPIATNQILGSIDIVANGGNGPYTNCASLGQTDSDASNDKACATVQKDYGNLTVVKEVENNTQPQVSTVGLVYPVTVTCGSTVTNLSLIDGMPQTVGPIPFNTTCSVVEGTPPMPSGACPAGQLTWTKSKIPESDVQILSGVNATVRVHNKLDCAPSDGGGNGSLVVTKTVINKVMGVPFPTGLTYPVTVTCGSMVTPLTLSENVPQTVSNIPTPASCHVQEGTMPTVNLPCAMMGQVPTWTTDYLPTQDINVTGANTPVTVQNTIECKPPNSNGFKLTVNKVVTNRTDPQIPVTGTVFAISTSCASGMSPAVVTPMPLPDGASQAVSGLANNTTCNITETLPPPPVTTTISCLPHFSPVWSTLPVAPVTISNADATATVQNFLDCVPDGTGQLMVKKVVTTTKPIQLTTANFPVTVTCGSMVTNLSLSSDGTPQTVSGIPMPGSCLVSEDTSALPNVCPNGLTPTWSGPNIAPNPAPISPGPIMTVTVTNSVDCTGGGNDNGYVLVNKFIDNQTNDKSGAYTAVRNALVFPITVTCNGNDTLLNVSVPNTEVVHAVPVGQHCSVAEGALPPAPPSASACSNGQVPTWGPVEYSATPAGLPTTVTSGQGPAIHVKNTLICAQGTPPVCQPPMVPGNVPGQCVCPPGMVQTGGGCMLVPPPPPVCQPPMVSGSLPGQCVCPSGTILQNGTCVTPPPPPRCKPPMIPGPAKDECICPPGTKQLRGRCIETIVCHSPAKLNSRGTACSCPKGMVLKRNTCVEPERKRPSVNGDDVIRALPGLIGPGGFGGGGRSRDGGGDSGGGGGYKPPGSK